MSIFRAVAVILFAAVILPAQMPTSTTPEAAVAAAVASLEQRQTVQRLSQILRTLQTNMKVADNVKAEVDKLAAEATPLQNAGNAGEARRRLLHAIAFSAVCPGTKRRNSPAPWCCARIWSSPTHPALFTLS